MPCKRHLVFPEKDPDAIIRGRRCRFEQKCRLAQIGPDRKCGHLLRREMIRTNHHGDGIALQGNFTKDIHLTKIETALFRKR
ncbi:hypothetical protein BGC30_12100 [Novacetimonas hansenii]|nr:hypothetical protein BGC30_12100 [Novacetimonas hansenii]